MYVTEIVSSILIGGTTLILDSSCWYKVPTINRAVQGSGLRVGGICVRLQAGCALLLIQVNPSSQ